MARPKIPFKNLKGGRRLRRRGSLHKTLFSNNFLSVKIYTDRYYTSNTYTQLADESTEFYLKSWQEIYELLKQKID